MRFLRLQEVLEIHDQVIEAFGGLFGIRDLGLLQSAIEMPKSKISKKFLHKSLFDKAAAYLFHICQNHPFIDGNKRTAVVSALVFLEDNNVSLSFDEKQFEDLVIQVAKGKADKKIISLFLKKAQSK